MKMIYLDSLYLVIVCLLSWDLVLSDNSHLFDFNLPEEHVASYFYSHPDVAQACKESPTCQYKSLLNNTKCWGYEKKCRKNQRRSTPACNKSSKGWVKSKDAQIQTFFTQGDFGYIKERLEEIVTICAPKDDNDSFFECVKYMRFCRGRNIMFDFETLVGLPEPMRYREDIIRKGQVGGRCKLKKNVLQQEGQHKSPLQSWYAEFEHFTETSYLPNSNEYCDVIIDKPTFVMKLDATVNMYHHFCDFLNLYASLHMNDSFTTDVNILIWDTIPYISNFEVVWNAFTDHPIMNLGDFRGKKVCFKDAVFPLLPRMIFGMYYNMPLVPGCLGSSLFKAFAEFLKHRLKIKQQLLPRKVRVTLISRNTPYRKILNEDELVSAMKSFPDLVVQKVNFNRKMTFMQQMEISYNTDILIGIHGAGLTHMLFLPEWASAIEIYNCDDESCYADLARLKGLKYLTWERPDKLFPEDEGHHPTLGAHAKFTNYRFDVEEFLRLVKIASDHVQSHPLYVQHNKQYCEGSRCNDTIIHNEL